MALELKDCCIGKMILMYSIIFLSFFFSPPKNCEAIYFHCSVSCLSVNKFHVKTEAPIFIGFLYMVAYGTDSDPIEFGDL